MHMYASSQGKRKSFYRKSELQMFLSSSGGHLLMHQNGTPIWHLHTKLYKGGETFQHNSKTVGLRLGQIVYMCVYNISFSWLLPLHGFQFIFCCVMVKNNLYNNSIANCPTTTFYCFYFLAEEHS